MIKKIFIFFVSFIFFNKDCNCQNINVLKTDYIQIGQYEIIRNLKPPTPKDYDSIGEPVITQIKRNGKVLKEYWGYSYRSEEGWTDDESREWNKIEIGKFIKSQNQQVLISIWGGGANGGGDYELIDLSPKFRILFSGRNYGQLGAGYYKLCDINNDGFVEIIDLSDPWKHLLGGFAPCVIPKIIFSFNKNKNQYEPSNNQFPDYFEKEILNFSKDKCDAGILDKALKVSSCYWYQGRKKEGWKKFNEIFKGEEAEKMKKDLEKNNIDLLKILNEKLKEDPYIQALKRNGSDIQ